MVVEIIEDEDDKELIIQNQYKKGYAWKSTYLSMDKNDAKSLKCDIDRFGLRNFNKKIKDNIPRWGSSRVFTVMGIYNNQNSWIIEDTRGENEILIPKTQICHKPKMPAKQKITKDLAEAMINQRSDEIKEKRMREKQAEINKLKK